MDLDAADAEADAIDQHTGSRDAVDAGDLPPDDSGVADTSIDVPAEVDGADAFDAGGPDSEPDVCASYQIGCSDSTGTVADVVMVGVGENVFCTLTQYEERILEPPQIRWQWRDEDERIVALSQSTRPNTTFVLPRTGRGTVEALTDDCLVPGPIVVVTAPTNQFRASVSWTSEQGDILSPDIDLHVLRTADTCWGDPENDLYFATRPSLDWGELGSTVDDPFITQDQSGTVGTETAEAMAIPPGEAWLVGLEIAVTEASGPVRVVVDIYVNSELALSEALDFSTASWWRVGTVSATGFVHIDEQSDSEPLCQPVLCDDGTPSSAELCNGVDDDCDGEVDEAPDTCINEGESAASVCVFLDAFDRWDCVR